MSRKEEAAGEVLREQTAGEPGVADEFSLEEAFARLEEIAGVLEDPDTTLEEAFRLYQQGVGLLKTCAGRLDTVEKKMLELDEKGALREFPG